jgi:hypothetical protein
MVSGDRSAHGRTETGISSACVRTYIQDVSGAERPSMESGGGSREHVAEEGKAKRGGTNLPGSTMCSRYVPKNKDEQRACLPVTNYFSTLA